MSLRRPTTRAIASPVDFELEHESERRCVMTFCTSSWSISTGKKRPAYLRRYSTRYLEI